MDKISYALGINVANNLVASGITTVNIEDFTTAVKDYLIDKTSQLPPDELHQILSDYFNDLNKKHEQEIKQLAEKNKILEKEFLAKNSKKSDVKTLPSGLQYKVITEGTGNHPSKHSTVKCHYEGRFLDGTVFDSSYMRDEPASFGLDGVIQGWQQGIPLMTVGSKFEFYIPYDLAYGPVGIKGSIPPCATLIFTVELLDFFS